RRCGPSHHSMEYVPGRGSQIQVLPLARQRDELPLAGGEADFLENADVGAEFHGQSRVSKIAFSPTPKL
ncbi:MAG: hypothetical protein NZR01_04545, partial [Bryobacteraceae bacterium]|nr:hypothetical protein [Bryobacteraceae bacterium]